MNTTLIAINILLVGITAWYAYTTNRLLSESQRTGADIKRLAEVAETSLRTLRQQIEAQTLVHRAVVGAAIQTALRNIEYWMGVNIPSLAAQYALPSQINLVPDNASVAVQYASLFSNEAAAHLASAFSNLRHSVTEIETIRNAKSVPVDFYSQHGRAGTESMQRAKQSLEIAMKELTL